jgi:hypothetical protein
MPGKELVAPDSDPQRLLRATIDALSRMDVSALMKLGAEAEQMAALRVRMAPADAGQALALKAALAELLQSTERSLRMLRGLHDTGIRRIEEQSTWER